MSRHLLPALSALVVSATFASGQTAEWKDPAAHQQRFVTVDSGVQLEVLDWGGTGQPVILLAGLGDTGHVFDDFAPMLTPRYRVLAVTRRAHGRSSAPPTGYDFARLAEDVMRVIDTLGVRKPVLIGHSFAGEELHVLGARYSSKIAGLVYVDAAFNRGDDSDNAPYNAVARLLPVTPMASPADFASFAALRSYLKDIQGGFFPEAHLRARYVANADGSIARMWAPEAPIRQAMSQAMRGAYTSYHPERIRVPAIAMFAAPKTASDMMRPWYPAGDTAVRERVDKLFALERARASAHMKWFEGFAPGARIVEISGAHHLFVSNPREVLEQIDAFMSSLPKG
jgi:pimeloyl-ACP methyl ester carboxylesterase